MRVWDGELETTTVLSDLHPPCRASAARHSAGACTSRGFTEGGQTVKFLFDAPPRKPLLWCCLLTGASRDLYPTGFDSPEFSSHIPYAAAETLAFQEAQIEIWQSFHSQKLCLLFLPLHLTPLLPPFILPLHIFRYNQGPLQMFLLLLPFSRLKETRYKCFCCTQVEIEERSSIFRFGIHMLRF